MNNAHIVNSFLILVFTFVTIICITGCRSRYPGPGSQAVRSPLSGKKILMVIAPKQFRDEELFVPREYFLVRGATVTVASSATGEIRGMLGRTFTPEAKIADVSAADFDAVIFVGGAGAEAYFDDPVAHKLARDADGGGKVLGAICIAPAILAKAGVLKGRSATAFASVRQTLVAGEARVMDSSCVREGMIVTADGPAAAEEFAAAVAKALTEN
ncbi:MAG: DJ-1/PfpI family protein [Phycisphaerae bacterium]|nr:DJ-1/PfpI family protein [Phycisphaerae bacterium]